MSDVWRKFPVTVSWQEPWSEDHPGRGEVVGTVIGLGDFKGKAPQMIVRTPEGLLLTLNVTQARLHELLARLDPQEGDKIRIRYLGESDKSLNGQSPAKRFTVEVWPQSSQPPAKSTSGESINDSAQEAGT